MSNYDLKVEGFYMTLLVFLQGKSFPVIYGVNTENEAYSIIESYIQPDSDDLFYFSHQISYGVPTDWFFWDEDHSSDDTGQTHVYVKNF